MTTEEKLDLILSKLEKVELRLDKIELRLDKIESDTDVMKRRMSELESGMTLVILKLDNLKHWTNLDQALLDPKLRSRYNLVAEA